MAPPFQQTWCLDSCLAISPNIRTLQWLYRGHLSLVSIFPSWRRRVSGMRYDRSCGPTSKRVATNSAVYLLYHRVLINPSSVLCAVLFDCFALGVSVTVNPKLRSQRTLDPSGTVTTEVT